MNCHEVKKSLSAYFDGRLAGDHASLVKNHLARCAACREEYASLLRIIEYMGQMESVEVPAYFLQKVHARLEKRFSLKSIIQRLFVPLQIKLPLELAGATVIALLIFYLAGIRNDSLYEITVSLSPPPKTESFEKGLPKKEQSPKKGKGGSVLEIIGSADGKVIQSEYQEEATQLKSLLVEIPRKNYEAFLSKLEQLGEIQKPYPVITQDRNEFIRIRINLLVESIKEP